MKLPALENTRPCVVGLGYVGLPLAVALGERYPTVGYDINAARVAALAAGHDATLEVTDDELAAARQLTLTADPAAIAASNVYIVAVPTPVDLSKQPDLGPLRSASITVGKTLRAGDVVIYESTVYPGLTEDICVPLLETHSGLKLNRDFHVGYSPERINPGEKQRRLGTIVKVTSGSNPAAADYIDELYRSFIPAGTFKASSIKVAEAAKVVENTQRDLNIALINELAIMFNHLGINTSEVLRAAATKWNFLPFQPGLVGGHCIGVDPYFLIHKSQQAGYHPDVIIAGRRINDGMGAYIANQMLRLMVRRRMNVPEARVLILGMTFKEDCPDIRNTKVYDLYRELSGFVATVDIHDPWALRDDCTREFGIDLVSEPETGAYDAIIVAVAHSAYRQKGIAWVRGLGKRDAVVYDIKSIYPAEAVDGQL